MEAEQKQQVRNERTEWFIVFLCEASKQDRFMTKLCRLV